LFPGNEIQRKWRNIRDNFRKELQLQKKGTSGQGARKRRKYIYFDRLLFLLPILQERETSGNVTPPPSANESEPQDVTRTEMGEGSHTTNVRQQKKRSKKPTYEESLLKIIEEKSRDIDEGKSFFSVFLCYFHFFLFLSYVSLSPILSPILVVFDFYLLLY